jgi:hypothetical protein
VRTAAENGVVRIEDLPLNYNGVVLTEGGQVTAIAYREHMARVLGLRPARHRCGRQERFVLECEGRYAFCNLRR